MDYDRVIEECPELKRWQVINHTSSRGQLSKETFVHGTPCSRFLSKHAFVQDV